MTWNVGDEIIVQEKTFGRGSAPVLRYVVTKVARKYFQAKKIGERSWRETSFEIATGREKDNGSNYHDQAYTPEQWDTKQRREALRARLRDHKVEFASQSRFGWGGHRLSESAIEGILAILDAERDRIAGEKQ